MNLNAGKQGPEQNLNLETFHAVCYKNLFSGSEYPAVDYYWPMKRTNLTVMRDEAKNTPADLHKVNFIDVRRLGWVVRLNNVMQWIDVDAGKDFFG